MQTIKDYSYGVVPVLKEGDQWKVFLIHQIPRQGTLFWTLPKGHPEDGESHVQTALRELQEETGIVPDRLDDYKKFEQHYTFKHEDQSIEKQVVYYLGYVSSTQYTVQIDEVKEAGWFTFDEASEKITHDIARGLLTEVREY